MENASEVFDLELSCEAVDDSRRHVREVFKEDARKTRGAELDGEAQTAMIATMGVDEPVITVAQGGSSGSTVPG
jgi:hypothetical protein